MRAHGLWPNARKAWTEAAACRLLGAGRDGVGSFANQIGLYSEAEMKAIFPVRGSLGQILVDPSLLTVDLLGTLHSCNSAYIGQARFRLKVFV